MRANGQLVQVGACRRSMSENVVQSHTDHQHCSIRVFKQGMVLLMCVQRSMPKLLQQLPSRATLLFNTVALVGWSKQ